MKNALGQTQRFDYDALGRPVAVTDHANRTTQYAWSSNGRIVALTDPKGGEKSLGRTGSELIAASIT